MSTLFTLFSGLAAVIVLYWVGGLFRSLPPVLRALLASCVPLLVYFLSIVGRWPGLDVVAIHISVFLAAGLVLHILTLQRRRSTGGLHWVPKLLIGFFAGLVVINATLLYIATRGLPEPVARWWLGSEGNKVYSGFSGVVPHHQDAAKAVSSALTQAHDEMQLGWQVEVDGLQGVLGEVQTLQVRAKDRTGLPLSQLQAEILLLRPGAPAANARLPLRAAAAGVYVGALTLPEKGRWIVELRLSQGDQTRYRDSRELVVP
jgi:nitrogen fixation protein FixH